MRYRMGFILIVATALAAGCHGAHKRQVALAEPGLDPSTAGTEILGADPSEGTIVHADPPPSNGFVDRHPMLAAPRDIYNSTRGNKVVKTAAGVVVGVPVGVVGEVKQIFVGTPPELR